jgi:hypothetical protein
MKMAQQEMADIDIGTWRKAVVGREPRRVGEKSCLWVAGIHLGMGRAKTVEKCEGRKERLGLMGAWRWSGWCADKGSGFSIGPRRPVCTATVTDSNKTT